jgi:hypothetical protein
MGLVDLAKHLKFGLGQVFGQDNLDFGIQIACGLVSVGGHSVAGQTQFLPAGNPRRNPQSHLAAGGRDVDFGPRGSFA